MFWKKAPNKEEPDCKGHNLFRRNGQPQKRKVRAPDSNQNFGIQPNPQTENEVAPTVGDDPTNAEAHKKPPVQDQSSPQFQLVDPFAACFFFDGCVPLLAKSMFLLVLDELFSKKFHLFCELFVNKKK